MHEVAPELDAWTAGGLRASGPPLPAVSAELFIQAGATVAEQLTVRSQCTDLVEATLRRAARQAARLLDRGRAEEGTRTP